jgi:hypothetical protein
MTATLGALLVALGLVDVFLTVLHYDGSSLLGPRVNRGTWWAVRTATAPLPRRWRSYLRCLGAPLMIPVALAVWLSLEVVGFALALSARLAGRPVSPLYGQRARLRPRPLHQRRHPLHAGVRRRHAHRATVSRADRARGAYRLHRAHLDDQLHPQRLSGDAALEPARRRAAAAAGGPGPPAGGLLAAHLTTAGPRDLGRGWTRCANACCSTRRGSGVTRSSTTSAVDTYSASRHLDLALDWNLYRVGVDGR